MARSSRRSRKRLETPEPLEDVLDRAGENRFAKKKPPIPVADWRAIVGPRIAERAHPIAIERGALVLRVTTSVWANELSMLAPELVRRLVSHGFAVKELRFRVGALDVQERPPERRTYRKVPAPAPLGPELQKTVDRVADDDLRTTIEAAARANLAWQTNVNAAPRDVRAPRDAGRGSARPDRNAEGSGAASQRTNANDSYRRR